MWGLVVGSVGELSVKVRCGELGWLGVLGVWPIELSACDDAWELMVEVEMALLLWLEGLPFQGPFKVEKLAGVEGSTDADRCDGDRSSHEEGAHRI